MNKMVIKVAKIIITIGVSAFEAYSIIKGIKARKIELEEIKQKDAALNRKLDEIRTEQAEQHKLLGLIVNKK